MKLRPTIFLSGVSSEFASFRDAVEIEVQKKGCFAENQPSFAPDYRTVEAMVRQRLTDADAVIHIVGFRFGAEPNERPADKTRRSYTQMEFDIAREMEKPIYVFLSSDEKVRDAGSADEKPEDKELQLAHRQAVQNTNHLFYFFKDKEELCKLAAEIPQAVTFDFRADISRIVEYAPAELIGREDELALINDAWLKVRRAEPKRPHILTFVALGGEGKTSLVAKWAAELAHQGWPGCDSAFAWSFYSQGTRDQNVASSDLFLKEAITFFGNEADKEFAASNAGPYEKGQRLARIVGQRRSLLILDGLEPLQYAPTSPTPGELKDLGIGGLLKALAADSEGLCVVTTRYSLPNLKAFRQTTAPEITLTRLSQDAGVHLLESLGVSGPATERKRLVEDVKGHALTLNLLGTYLRDAHGGDVRRRDLVTLGVADAEEQGGHAFRVIEAYEGAFKREGAKGERAVAVLRILGLFDRPVSRDCLAALLEEPAIPALTDGLVGLNEAQRNFTFKRLEDARLLTVNRDASRALVSLDAHPLLREYFAHQLRTQQPDAWREAHRRLYEYLCATTAAKDEPTLEDLQPLYQAVAHGCQAGLQQEVCDTVYLDRILRGTNSGGFYSTKKLGAIASDLGAVACFFEVPWSKVSPLLTEAYQAWVSSQASYRLHALGRLTESLEPMRAAMQNYIKREVWQHAAILAGNLTQLELMLGQVADATSDAEQSVIYADRSGISFQQAIKRAGLAEALHQSGRRTEAERLFREAEQMQKENRSEYAFLYSEPGFWYCNLLLAVAERAAWQSTLNFGSLLPPIPDSHSKVLRDVSGRAAQTQEWVRGRYGPLHEAFDHLTLARVALYEARLGLTDSSSEAQVSKLEATVDHGINSLHRAGQQRYLPLGFLLRAWFRFLSRARLGSDSAQEDLNEAWDIAERGPMTLHMVDIRLYRARLFFREKEYPWESPRKDLGEAERLINQCGYHRRDEELADAKRVILDQSV